MDFTAILNVGDAGRFSLDRTTEIKLSMITRLLQTHRRSIRFIIYLRPFSIIESLKAFK